MADEMQVSRVASRAALIFVTGGARSGKSRFALDWAGQVGGDDVTFIATAEGLDDEMMLRIARHRLERNSNWRTIEAPRDLERAVAMATTAVVVVDCLSLWVSNLMLDGVAETEIIARAEFLTAQPGRLLLTVTNEVGLGIVPDNALARAYRDSLGRVNQTVASRASEAHMLVSGLPIRLK